ncbi:hypothetical protein OEA41_000140 [Lepraria neglecta]|uniref:AB hydrolase-1 domain-containing protein n=1 Tax=Lepraria neglecta TaxID=209136 RepID=A0AAD9ZG30_9LECA|nr:hypothetical protein OEA41_000140 [Lepraria neglecta]
MAGSSDSKSRISNILGPEDLLMNRALYAHNVHTAWWQGPNKPEQFGFLIIPENQVRPFTIITPDGEKLYAWHTLPLSIYIKNEDALVQESASSREDPESSVAFKLLVKDPESRLIINFHGNAGTVAQGWRTDTYRALTSGLVDKLHVVAVDYRGFGYSTGSPDEKGLIIDGVATVKWALNVAKIPPEKIVLLGQSLGTAVATAVAEHFVVEEGLEFRGVVLVAGFSDLPTLLTTYAIGGIIPILSPLRPYPRLQQFFAKSIQETWFSATRLVNLVRKSKNINLRIIHAQNDFEILWTHSNTLFSAAANATSTGDQGLTQKQIDALKIHQDLGESGFTNSWITVQEDGGRKSIKQDVVRHGGMFVSTIVLRQELNNCVGHNRLVTYPVVAKAIANIFQGEDSN